MKHFSIPVALAIFVLIVMFPGCKNSSNGNNGTAVSGITVSETLGKATVMTLPVDIEGKAVLDSILAAYRGKVVLIDFWATWCPPCRRAMKEIDVVKPSLIEKGATFVYITGETSPRADWREAIKEIEGDHFRITDGQWESLLTALDIPGIPAYLLVGRDGETLFSNLTEGGYPGNDVIAPLIEKKL